MKGRNRTGTDYIRKGLDHKILSVEEEDKLAIEIENGNEEARETLIVHNLRLVMSIAHSLGGHRGSHSSLEFEDIVQQGYYGLIKAVDLYDRKKGTRFSTYATYWIKAEILEIFDNESRPIDVGLQVARAIAKVKKVELEFLQLEHRNATYQELLEHPTIIGLANHVRKTPAELLACRTQFDESVRLDTPFSDSEGSSESSLLDYLPDTETETPEVEATRKDMIEYMLSDLTTREQRIIKLYYGIGVEQPMTHKQIGELLGLGEQRIQQIKSAILKNLKTKAAEDPELQFE